MQDATVENGKFLVMAGWMEVIVDAALNVGPKSLKNNISERKMSGDLLFLAKKLTSIYEIAWKIFKSASCSIPKRKLN